MIIHYHSASYSRTMFKPISIQNHERILETQNNELLTHNVKKQNTFEKPSHHHHHHTHQYFEINANKNLQNQPKINPQDRFNIGSFGIQPDKINHISRKTQNVLSNNKPHVNQINIKTQTSVDKIIESSLKNSFDKKPQIIVINQPIAIGTEGDLQPISTYDMNKGSYITGTYPPAKGIILGPMTFYEIDPLINMIDMISTTYSGFFNMLPKDQPIQGNYDKSLNVLDFYGKVRAFVNAFISVRVSLQTDVKFVVSRILTLRIGQEPMLKYYGFYNGFQLLKKRTIVYESKDPKFKVYASMVSQAVNVYNIFVNTVLSETYSLQKIVNFFDNEIVNVQTRNDANNMLFVVDKFNDVLMFVIHVLEARTQLLNNLSNMKKYLLQIKIARKGFENVLSQIDDRVEFNKKEETLKLAQANVQGGSKFTGIVKFGLSFIAIGAFLI